jgi:hypothetical protein
VLLVFLVLAACATADPALPNDHSQPMVDASLAADANSPADGAESYDDAAPSGPSFGLLGAYYARPDMTDLAFTRVDPTIEFAWEHGTPDSALGIDGFSISWGGFVQPEHTELYEFHTLSDDGVRLWVDDELLIDNWATHSESEDSGSIALAAGQKYSIVLQYFEHSRAATVALSWSSSSQARQIIPEERLFLTGDDG